MRDEGKVGAVAGLVEDGHGGDEAEHGGDAVPAILAGVHRADDDEQRTGGEAAGRDPKFLRPEAAPETPVQDVGDDAAQRAGDKVQEAEDGGVVTRVSLAQAWEVLLVVGAEDRIDGELAAE